MDVAVAYDGDTFDVATLMRGQARPLGRCGPDRLTALAEQVGDDTTTRWIWADTAEAYPPLLRHGVRVDRCHDLRLCHAILAGHEADLAADRRWARTELDGTGPTLLDELAGPARLGLTDVVAEHRRHQQLTATGSPTDDPDRVRRAKLRLLLSAESAGALVAAEMAHDGLPWDSVTHDRRLTELLGPRPPLGGRPARLQRLCEELVAALEVGPFNPDSPAELLQALHRAGIDVASTRKWELQRIEHPAIGPLLEYKRLARVLSANGWTWMDSWVHRGRFRPEYVVGGVVTGRWATRGGGALQLPKQLRGAVRADPGWKLVVADASQLEPRVLAAMARDERMAEAARGHDLYQGLVDAGVTDTRPHAKSAMLGALYGATTGEGGRLLPRLAAAYPRAVAVVEQAARAGERGEVVSTFLGRRSPSPPERWRELQRLAAGDAATPDDARRARREAREWGRFTRNFVVQGTAAEWALCWLAGLRQRLAGSDRSGPSPQLVYFLHDEVIVHSPQPCAEQVAAQIREAATAAGRLLFGDTGVEFALDLSIVDDYSQAA